MKFESLKLSGVYEVVKDTLSIFKNIDEEIIYDHLYNSGVWLNEEEISKIAKQLKLDFNVEGLE